MFIRLARRRAPFLAAVALAALLGACGSSADLGTGGHSGTGGDGAGPTTTTTASAGGHGGAGTGGQGGAGGMPAETLDDILAELRADTQKALLEHAVISGWPVPVDGGRLFVSTDPSLTKTAGDHDGWAGTPMKADQGFSWAVIAVADGDHYKLTDGSKYAADPWSRSYDYDQYGEISLVAPSAAHLDRHFAVGDAALAPRTVRVWVPAGPIKHELYVHDGQNLFDPDAPWGGWHLQGAAPEGMLLVGVDNTPARFDEYTHVKDDIDGSGTMIGGLGDAYADFLENTVRPLVRKHYGEPGPVGVMGSSLGGLISFEIAYRYPGEYAFAASLSGTMGWGSIGAEVHNQTMIERYQAKGHQMPVLYLDSGGYGTSCADSDHDGIDDDDANAGENYCENKQMLDVLHLIGYADQKDLHSWYEPNAEHNEAAWAARVFRPLSIFDAM